MKRRNIKRIFWGISLLAAAIFLVMDQLHMFSFHLGFASIFWTVIFAATLIESLVNKSIFGSVFSVAFLLIVYAKPLRITRIVPWTILLAAFLIWIGLYLLFKRSWGPTIYVNNKKIKGNWSDLGNNKKFHAEHVFSESDGSTDDENIVISQKFSDVSRYIRSQNLRTVNINSSMGEVNVYLDAAKAAGDTVTVNINASMSEVALYIPLSWRVDDQLETSLGGVEINGSSTGDGPTLVLTGHSNLGDVEVNYV